MIPILLYEGVSGHEAMGALAALHAAELSGAFTAREAVVPTLEGARLVPSRLGWSTVAAAPAVVVPGGDTRALLQDAELTRALRARRGAWTLVSGDAIHLAARAELTHQRRTARPPDGQTPAGVTDTLAARLVADGRLLTCTGGDALVDLVLHYVAQTAGEGTAEAAAGRLNREWRPFAAGATHADDPA